MKVNIGKYKNWFGPYQLAKLIMFWEKEDHVYDEDGDLKKKGFRAYNLGNFFAYGKFSSDEDILAKQDKTWLYKFLEWIDSKKSRKMEVRIDNYDVWSLDHTLAQIIHPALIKLKDQKHGYPMVEDSDVPKNLRSTSATPLTDEQKDMHQWDDLAEARWEWVMDEMIHAFSQAKRDNWDDDFMSGEHDMKSEEVEFEGKKYYQFVEGPNSTFKYDAKGREKEYKRISNGLRLFAKYYFSLWD